MFAETVPTNCVPEILDVTALIPELDVILLPIILFVAFTIGELILLFDVILFANTLLASSLLLTVKLGVVIKVFAETVPTNCVPEILDVTALIPELDVILLPIILFVAFTIGELILLFDVILFANTLFEFKVFAKTVAVLILVLACKKFVYVMFETFNNTELIETFARKVLAKMFAVLIEVFACKVFVKVDCVTVKISVLTEEYACNTPTKAPCDAFNRGVNMLVFASRVFV